jgi:hypothetical protein
MSRLSTTFRARGRQGRPGRRRTRSYAPIRRSMAEVVRLNTGLEASVAESTRELHERERSLKMVLDGT